jgi:hypothetical protein
MLRVDFLRHHKLAMDALSSTLAPCRTLFSELPEMTNSSGNFPPPKHGVEHHIVIFGRPVTLRFSRLDPGKQLAAKKEFEEIEAADIIRRYNDCWSSPLLIVHKTNVSWRPSGELYVA